MATNRVVDYQGRLFENYYNGEWTLRDEVIPPLQPNDDLTFPYALTVDGELFDFVWLRTIDIFVCNGVEFSKELGNLPKFKKLTHTDCELYLLDMSSNLYHAVMENFDHMEVTTRPVQHLAKNIFNNSRDPLLFHRHSKFYFDEVYHYRVPEPIQAVEGVSLLSEEKAYYIMHSNIVTIDDDDNNYDVISIQLSAPLSNPDYRVIGSTEVKHWNEAKARYSNYWMLVEELNGKIIIRKVNTEEIGGIEESVDCGIVNELHQQSQIIKVIYYNFNPDNSERVDTPLILLRYDGSTLVLDKNNEFTPGLQLPDITGKSRMVKNSRSII